MSYAEDIRSALASVSGVSRRAQALHDLGLKPKDEKLVQTCLDEAVDRLLTVRDVLAANGVKAQGLDFIAASAKAGQDKSWRETVYGGKKTSGTTVVRKVKSVQQKHDTATPSAPEVDVAHPWRSE